MDPSDRIEALEREVRELRQMLARLTADSAAMHPAPGTETAAPPARAPGRAAAPESGLVHDVRERVEHVLGGDSDDNLETHIGAVWLSRLAVVVVMTAIALFAREAFNSEELAALQKVALGYAMAAAFMAYGMFFRKRSDLFSQAILGAGLAGLYFTTYAAFFVEQMRLVAQPFWGLPAVGLCLLILAGVSHWRRSQTVAGIALFLAYYTVVVSCMGEPTLDGLTYALFTCTLLALTALVLHALHRWMIFTWAALVATHATYVFFFLRQPEGVELAPQTYFWISNGFLAVCYVLFSLAFIIDARKSGEYRRMVGPMCGFNSFVFFALTWVAIHRHYPAQEWAFRTAFAAMLALFAVLADRTGPRRNYLYQIFIAKAVIMITLALESWFRAYATSELLLVAMAIECLGLAFSYKRSGVITFKVLAFLLMLITAAGTLVALRAEGIVHIGPYAVPSNWFCAVGVAAVFALIACFYENFVRRLAPEQRTVRGQWLLADTVFDLHSATMAVLHAALGAIILLSITIVELSENPALPYILAAEGLAMAALGFVLRTPQVDVASVLLLAAAHVAFHVFLWMGLPGFTIQENFAVYTALVAGLTYFGAYLWERYLRRFGGQDDWEHNLTAALPYLAATFMLTTLLGHLFTGAPIRLPGAEACLGAALLLVACWNGYVGVTISGIFALALATVSLYLGLSDAVVPFAGEPHFLPWFLLYLAGVAAGERFLALGQRRAGDRRNIDDLLRTGLVTVAVGMGLMGLFKWGEGHLLTFYVLGLAVAAIVLGAVFREQRYRWAALLLFMLVIGRAFLYVFSGELSPIYQVLTFAAVGLVLLPVSWAYSRLRQRLEANREAEPPKTARPHGRA